MEALQQSILEIKLNLHAENMVKFNDYVDVHMQHIQSGLSQMGNLHAFTSKIDTNNVVKQEQQQQQQQPKVEQ